MNKQFINKHITTLSIILFFIFCVILNVMKPHFLYNKDGSLREFGLGFKKRTVIPIWIMSIFLSILSYFILMYYSSSTHL